MPITQDRMIALTTSYRQILNHYTQANTQFRAAIAGIKSESGKYGLARQSVMTGEYLRAAMQMQGAFDDLEEIGNELFSSAGEILLSAHAILLKEEAHFNFRRKFNEHKRLEQQSARDRKREGIEAETIRQNSVVPQASQRGLRLCPFTLGDERCMVSLSTAPQPTCDKTFKTCDQVFHNRERYGGYPYIEEYDATNDGIPELPQNYTREDYERERRERNTNSPSGLGRIASNTTQS